MRVQAGLAAVVLAATAAPSADANAAAKARTKYSLANGCVTIATTKGKAVPGARRLRFKAADLGRYLLYRTDKRYLAAGADGSVGPAEKASPAAVWVVSGPKRGRFTFKNEAQSTEGLTSAGKLGAASRLRVLAAKGCAAYPEAPLNARGTPKRSSTSYGKVGGIIEGHMHWMSF